jgi:hypothetical protein
MKLHLYPFFRTDLPIVFLNFPKLEVLINPLPMPGLPDLQAFSRTLSKSLPRKKSRKYRILVEESGGRKTYYTREQKMYN